MADSAEVIRLARELNPHIRVLARAGYLRGIDALRQAGADAVFSGEGEVALAMAEAILESSGRRPNRSTATRPGADGAGTDTPA